MTDEEAITRVLARFTTVWPHDMTDPEVEEWVETLRPYELADADAAITILKRTDHFRPSHSRFVETVYPIVKARVERGAGDRKALGAGALMNAAQFREWRQKLSGLIRHQQGRDPNVTPLRRNKP